MSETIKAIVAAHIRERLADLEEAAASWTSKEFVPSDALGRIALARQLATRASAPDRLIAVEILRVLAFDVDLAVVDSTVQNLIHDTDPDVADAATELINDHSPGRRSVANSP